MKQSQISTASSGSIKDRMYAGDKELILEHLSANSTALGNALAIGACVKNRFSDARIAQLLIALERSSETVLGVRVGDLATAALHELGIKQYAGNDPGINAMIAEHFSFAL